MAPDADSITCSASSLAAGEDVLGSAAQTAAWVCLEQDGPWGAKAFTASHLDPALGAEIERLAGEHGVRAALIRRPGRHADSGDRPRTVLIGTSHPSSSALARGEIDRPDDLLDLDWAAVAAGAPDSHPALRRVDEQHLLVCTNGTRDTCCARLGRPVVAAAHAAQPDRVWEVTHASGHRFAPTSVLLPSGHLHGRITDPTALLASADEGRLVLDGWRGRSAWPAPGQAAEGAVRRAAGVVGLDDLTVVAEGDRWVVEHVDGRRWTVAVEGVLTGTERVESCGKDHKPVSQWRTTLLNGPELP